MRRDLWRESPMFKSKNKNKQEKMQVVIENKEEYIPKWEHPKILLIDIENDVEIALKSEGYNVLVGSFGIPYKVSKSDNLAPVIMSGFRLPNYTEQEIIIIDLEPAKASDKPDREKQTSDGQDDWWASCSEGIIDPRPRVMQISQKAFDRILYHGGIFIIFAEMRQRQDLKWGHLEYRDFIRVSQIDADNWCFLSILNYDNIETGPDYGYEMTVIDSQAAIGQLLQEHLRGASFECTLNRKYYRGIEEKDWATLAINKYGAPVACAITTGKKKGWILIFPRLQNRPLFLTKLLKEVLPDLSPHLFPDFEGTRWVQRPEYEIADIQELKIEINRIEEESKQKIEVLKEKIEIARSEMSYLHDLIRETGYLLVASVKKSFEVLGFQSVIDVDEEMKRIGDSGPKREDLQIHDTQPILLIEVKGIAGLPKDAEALQVWKYIAPRMREWHRTDIQGLSIINHQRNIPALERENEKPFRDDILVNAEEQKFGLLTTWDLFRLTRSFLKNGWTHEYVRNLFYQSNRINPIPTHYEHIGKIEKFWEKIGVIGIRIENSTIKIGDRIAFELPVEYEEQQVESLQVDNTPVEQAEIGILAGIKTHLIKEQVKKGIRVFKIIQ